MKQEQVLKILEESVPPGMERLVTRTLNLMHSEEKPPRYKVRRYIEKLEKTDPEFINSLRKKAEGLEPSQQGFVFNAICRRSANHFDGSKSGFELFKKRKKST
jgi:hypothetical protein